MDILEIEATRWAKIRSKGRYRFIWLRYVFGYGIVVASLLIIGDIILFTWHPQRTLYFAVVFPLAGYILGALTWRKNESLANMGDSE